MYTSIAAKCMLEILCYLNVIFDAFSCKRHVDLAAGQSEATFILSYSLLGVLIHNTASLEPTLHTWVKVSKSHPYKVKVDYKSVNNPL